MILLELERLEWIDIFQGKTNIKSKHHLPKKFLIMVLNNTFQTSKQNGVEIDLEKFPPLLKL